MEKSDRQGANRSHTAWYGEDLQRSRTFFLQAKAAVRINQYFPRLRLPKPLDFYTVLGIETRDGAHTLVTSKTERKLWTTKNSQ